MLTPLFVSARPLPSRITISSLNPNQNPSNAAKAPNFDQFKENPEAAIKVSTTAPWMKGPLFLPPEELIDTSHHHHNKKSTRKQEKTFKALNRRESGVRGSKAMNKIVRSVEKLDEGSSDYGGEFKSLEEAESTRRRMPWEREEDKFILRRTKKERVSSTADLILEEGLLKRLRLEGSKLRKWVNVRKAGVTEAVVSEIRSIWEGNELAMVRFDVPLSRNMERAQEILELKTGGLVVLSKKEFLVVYRGPPTTSSSSVWVKKGQDDEISSSLYEREGERLLNGLGPRYMDWWMRRPFPVDADLLPQVVDGYKTPSRRCPPNTRAKLSDEELTYLRNIAQALPFHFVLGRNHGLQGLASAIVKLWEKCVIAKIAIKWGALNTNNEEMADELKHLTGGVLILRNKYLIILFRGKDFLSDEVADLVDDRERLLRRYQHFEETKRESDIIEISEVVTSGEQLEETSKTGTLLEFQELERKFGEMEMRNLETEAEKAKLEKELGSQEHKLSILRSKIEKTTTELLKLNSLWKPSEGDDDVEILTNEERECLRRIGLKMNSSLVLGRRGVFDGVMEGLHQHWKHREVAKVITMQKVFSRVVYTATSLEAESNGVIISIEKLKEGHAILMYRGRNYKRPSSKLMAQNLLTKRKALQRSVSMQRLGSLKFFAYQRERAIEDLKLSLVKVQDSCF